MGGFLFLYICVNPSNFFVKNLLANLLVTNRHLIVDYKITIRVNYKTPIDCPEMSYRGLILIILYDVVGG